MIPYTSLQSAPAPKPARLLLTFALMFGIIAINCHLIGVPDNSAAINAVADDCRKCENG
jgi:hypothetical protein